MGRCDLTGLQCPEKEALFVKCLTQCPADKKHFSVTFLVRFSRKFVLKFGCVTPINSNRILRRRQVDRYFGPRSCKIKRPPRRPRPPPRPPPLSRHRPPPPPHTPPPAQAAPTCSVSFPLPTPSSAAPSQVPPGRSGVPRGCPLGGCVCVCVCIKGRGSHHLYFQSP